MQLTTRLARDGFLSDFGSCPNTLVNSSNSSLLTSSSTSRAWISCSICREGEGGAWQGIQGWNCMPWSIHLWVSWTLWNCLPRSQEIPSICPVTVVQISNNKCQYYVHAKRVHGNTLGIWDDAMLKSSSQALDGNCVASCLLLIFFILSFFCAITHSCKTTVTIAIPRSQAILSTCIFS